MRIVSIEHIDSGREVVSSELVEVMVGKERKGRRAADGHRSHVRML
jgi:hypothetical protein